MPAQGSTPCQAGHGRLCWDPVMTGEHPRGGGVRMGGLEWFVPPQSCPPAGAGEGGGADALQLLSSHQQLLWEQSRELSPLRLDDPAHPCRSQGSQRGARAPAPALLCPCQHGPGSAGALRLPLGASRRHRGAGRQQRASLNLECNQGSPQPAALSHCHAQVLA